MNIIDFQELIKSRQEWVDASRKNQFNFEDILAGLYTDPSHFVYELLQNADDVGAQTVTFSLFQDRLEVVHDGEDFNCSDVDGITGIGKGRMNRGDLNAIGKFGVGFKSVFAITKSPLIESGGFCFRIRDFVVPELIVVPSFIKGTRITLPFDHSARSGEKVYAIVISRLRSLGLDTLLFLSNIKEIKWEVDGEYGWYLSEQTKIQQYENVVRMFLTSENASEEYLVFAKPVEGTTRKMEVAFQVQRDDDKQARIVPASKSKLYAFFATNEETYLRFLVQGPYRTTPARDNIPLGDESNIAIIRETAKLVADSLTIVKELDLLTVEFLNILPIDPRLKDKSPIYTAMFSEVLDRLRSDVLLPTAQGKYAAASDVVLARGKDLIDLFSSNDIATLFGKTQWLHSGITSSDRTAELHTYLLNNLKIQEIEFESIARVLTRGIFANKTDEWMIKFYTALQEQNSLWRYPRGVLRTKPFIRTESEEHAAPFKMDGTPQVYLPADGPTKYQTVKRSIAKNEQCKSFFRDLGLHAPNPVDEILEFIIPHYSTVASHLLDTYYDDFEKLLEVAATQYDQIASHLKEIPVVLSETLANDQLELRPASQVYLPTDELKELLSGNESAFFVSQRLYERFDKKELDGFLNKLGVEDHLRRIKVSGSLSCEQRSEFRKDGYTYEIEHSDYNIDGLELILSNINERTSLLLWQQLLKGLEKISQATTDKFFQGVYVWFYYSKKERYFEASFIKTLRSSRWLRANSTDFKSPPEITPAQLRDDYPKDTREAKVLIEKLQFQPNVAQQYLQQLPENERQIYSTVRDLQQLGISDSRISEALEALRQQSIQEKIQDNWQPECEPNEIPIQSEEYRAGKNSDIPTFGNRGLTTQFSDGVVDNPIESGTHEKDGKDKKKIGRWGEIYVFEFLKTEYLREGILEETETGFTVIKDKAEFLEVLWLNKHSDQGVGYDFIVQIHGQNSQYIEVKTKKSDQPEFILITGTQWECARIKTEAYWIYVVSNAGRADSKITKIQDPLKLWYEGRIFAHPVNIKL